MDPRMRHLLLPRDGGISHGMRNLDNSIDLDPTELPIANCMRHFFWVKFVVNKVKAPLQRAILNSKRIAEIIPALISSASLLRGKFGDITKDKTFQQNAHCLIDHKAKFLSYMNNKGRAPLFSAAYDIGAAEVEHDNCYQEWLNVEVEFIIEDILSGKWIGRDEGTPAKKFWNEPAPYGGKYSIISKLQKHRVEILKLIEED